MKTLTLSIFYRLIPQSIFLLESALTLGLGTEDLISFYFPQGHVCTTKQESHGSCHAFLVYQAASTVGS